MIQHREIGGRLAACWVSADTFPTGQQTLVFIHGAGADHRHWERQYEALPQAFPIAAPDLPGHGASAGPGETEVGRYADWLQDLLGAWGIVRPVLIGHSLGAAIALSLASRRDTAAAVVAVGSGITMPVNPAFLAVLKADPAAAGELAVRYALAKANRERLGGLVAAGFGQTAPEVLQGDFSACDRLDLGAALGRIRVPALIVCGSEDRMTKPECSEGLKDAIAGARLSLIPGAGHYAMIEAPEAFNRELTAFVFSLAGGTKHGRD